MSIFNSLGSNYDFNFVIKSLFLWNNSNNLEKFLEEKYGGKAILLYKGREAISMALKIMDLPEGSEIAINGFTCVAVFNAIKSAGYNPVCLDLTEKGGLNFTPEILAKAIAKNKKIKAVVIQNTLGYPCNIEEIQKICQKNDLILIEDLAHSVGTRYLSGKESGTIGDFICLSFSQDKIIDAITGGALIIRNEKLLNANKSIPQQGKTISAANQIKNMLYPFLTYKIRLLYRFGLGKAYHFIVKKLGLLSNIRDESFYNFYQLPNWNAKLTYIQFKQLPKQLIHRKEIAMIYTSLLPESLFMFDRKKMAEAVELSSNLRFPIFIDNRSSLIRILKKEGIFLSDIWYTDVAPQCPNAVLDAKIILNLPTHINISKEDALRISQLINKWLSRQ